MDIQAKEKDIQKNAMFCTSIVLCESRIQVLNCEISYDLKVKKYILV